MQTLAAAAGGSTMTLWEVGLVFGVLPLVITLVLGGAVYRAARRPAVSSPAVERPDEASADGRPSDGPAATADGPPSAPPQS